MTAFGKIERNTKETVVPYSKAAYCLAILDRLSKIMKNVGQDCGVPAYIRKGYLSDTGQKI
jgi:hypothetical protein